ncbi:hypothetical protein KCH_25130 [Kitasatospora cheerisanensis KCTC 2395]|uniref:Uncharacterized protein n=1 Tax=Kitasatospora cheerisanensis KCTC 2395 TaxID=1348663 RepID=A0A066Z6Q9_9ACTN|nr:hypothetical protein KCH_25130 [Kitasatospora cheerisanensis KCTC 2395]
MFAGTQRPAWLGGRRHGFVGLEVGGGAGGAEPAGLLARSVETAGSRGTGGTADRAGEVVGSDAGDARVAGHLVSGADECRRRDLHGRFRV